MRSTLLALTLGLCCSVASAADSRFLTYDGEAFELDGGELLYGEQHWLRYQGAQLRERVVLYVCPHAPERVFARKELKVDGEPTLPQFELIDQRLGYREGLRVREGRWYAFIQRGPDQPEESAPIERVQGLVADAGFDAFVRQNWDRLVGGAKLDIDFLVPSELDALRFRVKRIGPTRLGDIDAETFRLSLGGLWGWLAPSIDVSYDARERQLLRFEGISNVRGPDGVNYRARIVFPPGRLRALPDGSGLAAARQRALVSNCR